MPDDIETHHAAMAICALGPSFTAMTRMRVTPEDTVLISGCGAVGLGAIVNARTIGARVIALELQPYRAELARTLGAELVIDPRDPDVIEQVQAATGGYGADAALDTSNNEKAPPVVLELVRARDGSPSSPGAVRCPSPASPARASTSSARWHWNCMTASATP